MTNSIIVTDVETTGLVPDENVIVSIGAKDYETGDEFYGECRIYDDSVVSDFALAVNGFTREQITDPSKPLPHELYLKFLSWATLYPNPIIAGQQVGSFDIKFLEALNRTAKQKWIFGYRSIDLHSIAFAKYRESLSLDGVLTKVGLSPEVKPHNALTGAKLEAEALKRLFNDFSISA